MKKMKKSKGTPEGEVRKFPSINLAPKIISKKDALEKLTKALDDQISLNFIEATGLPNRMNFSKTRNGIEFYDTESKRPVPSYEFAEVEELKDVGEWVKGWYFAILKKGDKTYARLFDKSRTTTDGNPIALDVVIEDTNKERPATPHDFTVEIETRLTLY